MAMANVYGGHLSDQETITMYVVPGQKLQPGDNSEVSAFDGVPVVIKTMNGPTNFQDACRLARDTNAYGQDLKLEPLASAKLNTIDVIGSHVTGEFRVTHSVERVHGPNLMDLSGEPLLAALGELAWSISRMRPYEGSQYRPFDPNVLNSGVDTTARNFIVDPNRPPAHPASLVRGSNGLLLPRGGTPVLIDHWPAYKRQNDGSFHIGRDSDDAAFCERAYGTKSGAIATLLFTGLYSRGNHRALGNFDEPAFYRDWSGLVPVELHDQVREDVKWYAERWLRSAGQLVVGGQFKRPNI